MTEQETNMNQEPVEERVTPVAQAPVGPVNEQAAYRWDYSTQRAFEEKQARKQQKRGAWSFALVMTFAFAMCLAILVGVLLWYENSPKSNGPGDGVNAGAVADVINPSTVLVYCTNREGYSYGTGFFIRSNGYIATNYHVVEGYDEITATLYSAERLDAVLIGFDKEMDLAVLKIEGSGYPVPTFGDSDAVAVGDPAIAIGHPSGASGGRRLSSSLPPL